RAKTRGERVVVTLADIGYRAASDVALQIGRDWKVGLGAPAGDPARNLGVIVLLVPRKDHRPGTGWFFIATGKGAEGFLTDAAAGRIRDAVAPELGGAARICGNVVGEAAGGAAARAGAPHSCRLDRRRGDPADPIESRQDPALAVLFRGLRARWWWGRRGVGWRLGRRWRGGGRGSG